ncbi:MAG: hypothetical protein HY904_18440 [Deltaproteobacteria bacterium]|nr:hypothetical protein [Deltaproteobacteria bacterium]
MTGTPGNGHPEDEQPGAPLEDAFYDTAPEKDARAIEGARVILARKLRWLLPRLGILLAVLVLAFLVVAGPRPATRADSPQYVEQARANGARLGRELGAPTPGPLHAAVGTWSIRPNPPNYVRLGGYPPEVRRSTGADGDLRAWAWVLRAGSGPACAVMGADLLMVTPELADEVATEVLALADIPRERIVFTASHTHSSIGNYGRTLAEGFFVGSTIPGVHEIAWRWAPTAWNTLRSMRPAVLRAAQADAPAFIVNRLDKAGAVDATMDVVQLDIRGDEPAVMVLYGAHTTSEPRRDWMSPDYPGPMRERVSAYAGAFVSFAAGAMGSMGVTTPMAPRNPDNIGTLMATTVMSSIRPRARSEDVSAAELRLACGRAPMPLPPLRVPAGGDWALTEAASAFLLDPPAEFNVSALLAGPLLLVSFPGELSGEVSGPLRAAARHRGYSLAIASFSGEYAGYLLPAARYGKGVEALTQFAGMGAAAPAVALVEGLLAALPPGPLPEDARADRAWPP